MLSLTAALYATFVVGEFAMHVFVEGESKSKELCAGRPIERSPGNISSFQPCSINSASPRYINATRNLSLKMQLTRSPVIPNGLHDFRFYYQIAVKQNE